MPFLYKDINTYQPLDGEIFLFDANVWIHYHDQTAQKYYQKPYTRFLNKLLRKSEDPTVYLPACVLGEVLNKLLKEKYTRFMQSEEGKKALQANPVYERDVFKKIYREHLQYKRDRDTIYESIFSFSPGVIPIEDEFHQITLDTLTTAFTDLEFNDWNIYELARVNNATLITDDADFKVENYPIVTNNNTLLALTRN